MIYSKGATPVDQCAHRLMECYIDHDWHGSTVVGDYIAFYHEERLYTVRHMKKGVSCLVYARSPYDAIEKVRIMEDPRWIPVTERLPECDLGAEVGNIEWISCGMVHSGCFGRGGKYRDAYFRTWTDAGEGMDAKDADYWRAVTLPKPPKEET